MIRKPWVLGLMFAGHKHLSPLFFEIHMYKSTNQTKQAEQKLKDCTIWIVDLMNFCFLLTNFQNT